MATDESTTSERGTEAGPAAGRAGLRMLISVTGPQDALAELVERLAGLGVVRAQGRAGAAGRSDREEAGLRRLRGVVRSAQARRHRAQGELPDRVRAQGRAGAAERSDRETACGPRGGLARQGTAVGKKRGRGVFSTCCAPHLPGVLEH